MDRKRLILGVRMTTIGVLNKYEVLGGFPLLNLTITNSAEPLKRKIKEINNLLDFERLRKAHLYSTDGCSTVAL